MRDSVLLFSVRCAGQRAYMHTRYGDLDTWVERVLVCAACVDTVHLACDMHADFNWRETDYDPTKRFCRDGLDALSRDVLEVLCADTTRPGKPDTYTHKVRVVVSEADFCSLGLNA